jgi:hypothetical protein
MFYEDWRIPGRPRVTYGPPPDDAFMRVPTLLLDTCVFIGGRDTTGVPYYGATAFTVGLGTEACPGGWPCLVTARHAVLRALDRYGNVCVRVNTKDGGSEDIDITEPWVYPEDAGTDLAAIPFGFRLSDPLLEALPLPPSMFVTDDVISARKVGPGEDLIVVGLFSSHVGSTRNLPIVRSGNLASMPYEPLEDKASGESFSAYLAEVRSVGGLSGSPVFLVLNPYGRHVEGEVGQVRIPSGDFFYLLGLIRGHWEQDPRLDFDDSEAEQLNTGIAMVTPISAVLPLFEDERFVRYAAEMDEALKAERRASSATMVEDFAEDESGEFENFEDLTDKLLRVPKKELDAKLAES